MLNILPTQELVKVLKMRHCPENEGHFPKDNSRRWRRAADNAPRDSQVTLCEWLDYATERVPRMQEAKLRETRGLKLGIAFVEGEEKLADVDKRSVQRPRVFYRREPEAQPLIVARP